MSNANGSGIDGYLPGNLTTGASVPTASRDPDTGKFSSQRSAAPEKVYGKQGFACGRWECRVSADRLVLDLPVADLPHTQSLVTSLGFMAFVALCVVLIPSAVGRSDWETVAGLVFCMSIPLLVAVVRLCKVVRRRNREVIVEPDRLLIGKKTGEPGQFDEEVLLVDSRASVSPRGRLEVGIGQRQIVLCSTLEKRDAERIRDQINGLLEGREKEDLPVYVERPGPS